MNDDLIGVRVGRFQLTRLVGRGRQASVYEAAHARIGSRVAVKVLHAEHQFDDLSVERFFREATLVNRIGHDGLVGVQDVGRLRDGRPYLVTELVDGRTLASMPLPLPLDELAPIALGLCDVLAAAHEAGVVHRDVRAENVFVVRNGTLESAVKLGDFGTAKLFSEARSATGTPSGALVGAAGSISPEQARGELSRIGPASDVYACGVLLYRLLTGRPPFEGTVAELIEAHCHATPPPIDAPAAIAKVVTKCLEKSPDDRFPSARELGEALLDAFGSARIQGVSAPRPATRPPIADPDRTAVRVLPPPTLNLPKARLSIIRALPTRRSEVLIAVGVFALVLVPGYLLLQRRAPTGDAIAPSQSSPSSLVELRVETQPSHATLRIVQGATKLDLITPATVELERDVPARLLLSSPGRLPAVATVTPTTATSLTYVLAPLPEAPTDARPARLDARSVDVDF